jgi:hypothetical protein
MLDLRHQLGGLCNISMTIRADERRDQGPANAVTRAGEAVMMPGWDA